MHRAGLLILLHLGDVRTGTEQLLEAAVVQAALDFNSMNLAFQDIAFRHDFIPFLV